MSNCFIKKPILNIFVIRIILPVIILRIIKYNEEALAILATNET